MKIDKIDHNMSNEIISYNVVVVLVHAVLLCYSKDSYNNNHHVKPARSPLLTSNGLIIAPVKDFVPDILFS